MLTGLRSPLRQTNTVKQWSIVCCDLPLRLASSNTPVAIHVVFTLLTKVELKQSRSVFALPVSGENYVSNVRDGFYAMQAVTMPTCIGCPPCPPPPIKKVERSIFVTLIFENITYFDFIS